jgi:hypothetical protein
MLKVYQHFSKHCNCHLQVECVLVQGFRKPHTKQAAGCQWDVKYLNVKTEEWAATKSVMMCVDEGGDGKSSQEPCGKENR